MKTQNRRIVKIYTFLVAHICTQVTFQDPLSSWFVWRNYLKINWKLMSTRSNWSVQFTRFSRNIICKGITPMEKLKFNLFSWNILISNEDTREDQEIIILKVRLHNWKLRLQRMSLFSFKGYIFLLETCGTHSHPPPKPKIPYILDVRIHLIVGSL